MRRTMRVIIAVALVSGVGGVAAAGSGPVAQARTAGAAGDAVGLLDALRDRYAALDSLAVEGRIVQTSRLMGQEQHVTLGFDARAAKGRYRVTWSTLGDSPPGMDPGGAVWNAGEGPFFYMAMQRSYGPVASDVAAISMATGVSRRAALIPVPLLDGFGDLSFLPVFVAPKTEGEESIDGETCWKVSGPTRTSKHETLWISKRRIVVRRHTISLSPSPEVREQVDTMADLSDDEIDQALVQMGVEPSKAGRERMRIMLDMAKTMQKHVGGIEGTLTMHHDHVRLNPRLEKSDFVFEVPPGTTKRSSPLEQMMSAPSAPPAE